MATKNNNSPNDFKSLNILYYALLAGQIMITLVLVFLLNEMDKSFSWDMSNPFHLMAPFIVFSSLGIASFLYSKRMEEGRRENNFIDKFEHYHATIILRSALIEGANLVCLVFFFVEQNYFFLFLFFVGFAAFITVRPSAATFKEKYKLNETERVELREMMV